MSGAVENMRCTYEWTSEESGLALSAFFWGYICTMLPGSVIALYFGSKPVYGWAPPPRYSALLTPTPPHCYNLHSYP